MQPNPVLKKLGFAADDRLVIVHADDVGMCQASLAAYADLVDFGLVSAASTMVPCPWFPAVAAFCRDHVGNKVDMGVHTTLTSEFAGYRWGPISTRGPASGLIDQAGYFFAESERVQAHANLTAVRREIQAQVERAMEAGIDVTHVDTHMGAVVHPDFLPAYVQVALQHGVPPFLVRTVEAGLQELGVGAEAAILFAQQLQILEARGLPLLDRFFEMPLDQPDNRLEQVKRVLAALPPGLTYLMIHPAQDTPELRAITTDWRGRVADYQTFTNKALDSFIKDAGIYMIGWRVLRDLMRSEYTEEL
jgi:predicted glycoside hydrolase/deacetylase ChbG (UPF0249 family)